VTRTSAERDPQRFDDFAERYAFVAARAHDPAFFLRNLPRVRGRALEVGCGAGGLARTLARHFDEVVAIDVSAPMLALARRDNAARNIVHRQMDANALALDGRFDFVVSHTTFHHLADVQRTLATLREHVACAGRIAVVDAVADRPALPAWRFLTGAPLAFPGDCLRHGPADALRMLRFRVSRRWLAHLTSDRYLSPQGFREVFGAALPGARFERAGRFLGAIWDAPPGEPPQCVSTSSVST
jgi:SAM-dependent methyltransferase